MKSRKYVRLYSKNVKSLLNAKFMNLIINPADIKSIRIVAYEKTTEDKLASLTCFLQFVTLVGNIHLKYMSFALHKKSEYVDIRKLATEQLDIEEALDAHEFIKL